MDHDILIISDPADKSATDMLARRLRALKFSVRNKRAPERGEPTDREYAEADASRGLLAFWSAASTEAARPQAQWMLAMAQRARDNGCRVMHASRGSARPGSPFAEDHVHNLRGLTGRKQVRGFVDLVDMLGASVARSGLAEWLRLDSGDTVGRAAWRTAHPLDPLSARAGRPSGSARTTPLKRQSPPPVSIKPYAIIPPPIAHELKPKKFDPTRQKPGGGAGLLVSASIGALLLFVFAYLARSEPLPGLATETGKPPFAAPCRDDPNDPDCGQVLQPGPIVDDTSDKAR